MVHGFYHKPKRIKDIIIVGSSNKRSIEDHFDEPSQDLVANLIAGGEKKKHYLEKVEALASMANFVYVRQKGPYGNATPLLSAAHLISDGEPFIYKFADDFFSPEANSTKQLIETYQKYDGGVFACKSVIRDEEYDQYGIADGEKVDGHTLKMSSIIEKPGKEKAPSDLASVSNYLFPSELIYYIEKASHSHTAGEFMLQPMVQQMIEDGYEFFAREIVDATFYDTGNPLEYLKTTFDFGLRHPDFGTELAQYLKKKLQ